MDFHLINSRPCRAHSRALQHNALRAWLTADDGQKSMNLTEIRAALEELRDPIRQRIEIAKTGPKQEEVTIFANREGLIRLAAYCLDLAERQVDGAHHHFDDVSVYEAEVPVVISLRKEPIRVAGSD